MPHGSRSTGCFFGWFVGAATPVDVGAVKLRSALYRLAEWIKGGYR